MAWPEGRAWRRLSGTIGCLLLAVLVAACQRSPAGTLAGTVVWVHDGDSAILREPSGRTTTIRLAHIDAPERDQRFGPEARELLRGLILDQQVAVQVVTIDQYGRSVAYLRRGEVAVNRQMLRLGGAWVYRYFSDDPALLAAEEYARTNRLGLWRLDAQPQPPWEWRRQQKRRGTGAAQSPLQTSQ